MMEPETKYYIRKVSSFPGGWGAPWCVWFGWNFRGRFKTWDEALRFVLDVVCPIV